MTGSLVPVLNPPSIHRSEIADTLQSAIMLMACWLLMMHLIMQPANYANDEQYAHQQQQQVNAGVTFNLLGWTVPGREN